MKIEYRVIPVTRYIVTRYHQSGSGAGGCETRGEFDRRETAYQVGYALCKAEHDASGEPVDSMNFVYPKAFADGPIQPGRADAFTLEARGGV